jgi:2-dehydropantoate 2-reductase
MSEPPPWPKIAVVGAGAVGGYFGGMLARAGAPVVMIARAPFVEAVNKNGLLLDTLHFKENIRVQAATELEAARGAQVILFCVKTTDTAATARALAPLLSPQAIILSMQNGVDNAEQIRAASLTNWICGGTIDVNTRRGFRMVLRDEPWQQYLVDHFSVIRGRSISKALRRDAGTKPFLVRTTI